LSAWIVLAFPERAILGVSRIPPEAVTLTEKA
jgi:hypothetical protein